VFFPRIRLFSLGLDHPKTNVGTVYILYDIYSAYCSVTCGGEWISQEWETHAYRDSQMASHLNQSKNIKKYLIQSQCFKYGTALKCSFEMAFHCFRSLCPITKHFYDNAKVRARLRTYEIDSIFYSPPFFVYFLFFFHGVTLARRILDQLGRK
jgi:hypothetical protein